MVKITRGGLMCIAYLTFPILARAVSSQSEIPLSETPSTNKDLICSNDDPTDCYPHVFEPTEEFQVIREGQDIPPGLHIRLDVSTGKKEARLNVPMEGDEALSALEGLPTEHSIVVVDQPEADTESTYEPEKLALRDRVNIKIPAYDNAGKVPPPIPDAASVDDMGTFQKALLAIKMDARAFDKSLDDLADLAHDIYYGVEITKDKPVLEKLICLVAGSGSERMPAKENDRDHKAASILSSAIQNNPTALKEIASFWRIVMYPTCGLEIQDDKSHVQTDLVAMLRKRLGKEKKPHTLKAKVSLISGLLREPTIRAEFLKKGGMEVLLAMFLKKGEQFDIVRKRVGQLVMDNFLDEGMDAALGEWPKSAVSDAKTCQTKGKMLGDGCWEHHVETFSKTEPGEEWTKELVVALTEHRGNLGLTASANDREL
ncbi:hypothetical protein G7Y89_g5484 [Cudoniella acicularis]|uniref:Nucleotide exchange factor SIL1 n=1 Tax=Cudoniella acicularis TaxID=354080 RepID=A0A8H4W5N9_9HELO|nr:hypothetical protein G7Y89_g5484 [Cudoniella acicularis]